MALPHFRNLTSTNTRWEPIYKNLFEITVDLPAIVRTPNASKILLENATNISLDVTNKDLSVSVQRFKYSTRAFLQTPSETDVKFTIDFNINQNDKKVIETWEHLKRWYDLIWNSQTGELHYKNDYIGSVTAQIHDRTGEVVRRVDFVNAYVLSVGAFDLSWDSGDIINKVSVSFQADYFNDTYFDIS
jgi:hypothetical protein